MNLELVEMTKAELAAADATDSKDGVTKKKDVDVEKNGNGGKKGPFGESYVQVRVIFLGKQ